MRGANNFMLKKQQKEAGKWVLCPLLPLHRPFPLFSPVIIFLLFFSTFLALNLPLFCPLL
ncbi:hypothetical protein SLEP1_g30111 [Rubroshorea leprosula]|uniref:Transmembrane protein n=1 Tax=Rubroshorea leprosula TaxID=152421 RepID=A0AAV5K4T9_9ROSI|nr:hypothetical protein SLEP1_g30111 [Rubroshorea leprosula]